ncbi:MAG TPA: TRAP transporter fused permease subunit [Methylomirabilota bacterium]|jgi:TRAP transporter 4TM/12TM fusion protein|nr:TRAP transporter fused permease subunit [Methylomirabilota bacterium]
MPDLRSPRAWLAIAWPVFQLYTAYAGMWDLLIQLPVHVAFATALGFLTPPMPDSPEAAARLAARPPRRWPGLVLAGLTAACAAHFVWHNERLASRMAMVDDPLPMDVAVSVLFVALLLAAAWRHIGPSLVIMALAFIAYVFVGPYLPGFLSHGGEPAIKLIDQQMLTTQGVFGIPTLVSATFIFLFVVFGSVMSYGGLLRFFTDGALAVAGSTKGGAGKVAVIASGLFGTVNGSAMANAVTTGAFTIPLMKRAGYRPEFAAGVEACASMGGQLIPPVMGAAAFIMAETLQMPYSQIAIAAAIPGVLYFVAVGVMVHFEAARQGLPVLPRAELPRLGAVLRRDLHLLAGPAVLVWFLIEGRSPMFAGFWALVVAFALSWVRRDTRIGARKIVAILADSAHAAMPVALACATVGIVVGVVSVTGLGLKLATGIVGIAGGSLILTLLMTMVAALVLGTGLPTSATYIITSIMAAPALESLGIPKLVAHMFVFYFGILADLTPPTAISTYATSSIAGADVWKTQWLGMTLALSGFIIPFSFAYDPALLLMNAGVIHIAWRTLAATLGIVMLGAGLIGYFRAPTRPLERALLLAGSLLLIFPGVWSDVAGIACFALVVFSQRAARQDSEMSPGGARSNHGRARSS